MTRDGTERIHDGGPEQRDRRRQERADAARRPAEPRQAVEKHGSVREFIDKLTGHGREDQ